MLPDYLLEAETGEAAMKFTEELAIPFTFEYKNGNVSGIRTSPEDPAWSINFKRALLTFFEVNMEKRRSLGPQKSSEYPEAETTENNFYRVLEPSIAGICETTYRVFPEEVQTANGEKITRIAKVRNYDNCIGSPALLNTMFSAYMCDECNERKTKPLQAATEMRYEVIGSETEFLIINVESESQYIVVPYSKEAEYAATYIRQALILLEEVAIGTAIPEPAGMEELEGGLVGYMPVVEGAPWPITAIDSLQMHSQGMVMEKIIAILTSIAEVEMMTPELPETAILFTVLKKMMREATMETLEQVMEKYCTNDPGEKMKIIKRVLLDVLPSVGTANATEILIGAIKKQHIPAGEAAPTFSILALAAQPDLTILKHLMEFADSSLVEGDAYLKRSVWLCVGALTQKINVVKSRWVKEWQRQLELVEMVLEEEGEQAIRSEMQAKENEIKEKITSANEQFKGEETNVVTALEKLARSENWEEKVLGIKAIGNSGLYACLPVLVEVLENKEAKESVRVQAIWAMKKISYIPEAKEEVYEVLSSCFFNMEEPAQIRIAAYTIMLVSGPPLSVLQMFAQALHRETDENVGSFVYSSLLAMSATSHPCLLGLAENVTTTLRYCKEFESTFPYSRFYHLSAKSQYLNMAGSISAAVISGSDEMMPRGATVGVDLHMWGATTNLVEVGVNSDGVQSVLNKLFGLRAEPWKSPYEAKSKVEEIKEKLKVKDRESAALSAHMYIKVFGHELFYFPLTETIRKFGNKMSAKTDDKGMTFDMPLEFTNAIAFADLEYKLPTEFGMPLIVRLDGSAMINTTGSLMVTAEAEYGNRRKYNNLKFELDFMPRVTTAFQAAVAVDCAIMRSGVALNAMVKAKMPVNAETTVNRKEGKCTKKFNMEEMRGDLLTISTQPVTFVMTTMFNPSESIPLPNFKIIPFAATTTVQPVSIEGGKSAFGINLGIFGQTAYTSAASAAFVPYCTAIEFLTYIGRGMGSLFSGEQVYILRAEPGVNPPEYYEIESQFKAPGVQGEESGEESGEDCGIYCYAASAMGWFEESGEEPAISRPGTNAEYSLVIKITDSNKGSPREIKIEGHGFCRNTDHTVELEIVRSLPEYETGEWKMQTKMEFSFPKTKISPVELFNPEYQTHVQQRIDHLMGEDGQNIVSWLIEKDVIAMETKNWAKWMAGWGARETVSTLVDQLLVWMNERTVLAIRPIVASQKTIKTALDKVWTTFYSAEEFSKEIHLLETAAHKSERVMDEIVTKMEGAEAEKDVEGIAMLQYCVMEQMTLLHKLFTVCNKANVTLPTEVTEACMTSLASQSTKYNKFMHTYAEAISESLKGIPASDIHTVLKGLIEFQCELQKKLPLPWEATDQKIDIPVSEFPVLLKKAVSAIKDIDGHMVESHTHITNTTQMLILIAALQESQIEAMTRIYIAMETTMVTPHSSKFNWESSKNYEFFSKYSGQGVKSEPGMVTDEMPKYLPILERTGSQIDWVAMKLVRRLEGIMYFTFRKRSVEPMLPEEERQLFASLMQARINQTVAGDILMPWRANSSSSHGKMTLNEFREGIEIAKAVMSFMEEELVEKITKQSSMTPIVMEGVKCFGIQTQLLKQAMSLCRKLIFTKAIAQNQEELSEVVDFEEEIKNLLVKNLVMYETVLSDMQESTIQKTQPALEAKPLGKGKRNILPAIYREIHAVLANILSQEEKLENVVSKSGLKNYELQGYVWEMINACQSTLEKLAEIKHMCKHLNTHLPFRAQSITEIKACFNKEAGVIESLKQLIISKGIQNMHMLTQVESSQVDLKRIRNSFEDFISARGTPYPWDFKGLHPFFTGVHASINMSYGMEGRANKEFHIKVMANKGLRQLLWEQAQASPMARSLITSKFLGDLIAERANNSYAYRKMEEELNEYQHVHLIAAYHKDAVPSFVRHIIERMYLAIKVSYFGHLSSSFKEETRTGAGNYIEITMNPRMNRTKMDMVVKTGAEVTWFSNIGMCFALRPLFAALSSRRLPYKQQMLKYATSNRLPAECRLTGNKLYTLDRAAIELPIAEIRGCQVALAMDCSNSSSFAIALQPGQESQKIVRVEVRGHTIDVIVMRSSTSVRVNNVWYDDENKVITVPAAPHEKEMYVDKKGRNVEIRGLVEGLYIFVNEEQIKIKAPSSFWSKLCGICGNYDGRKDNDMEGPSKEEHVNPKCFVASYLLPSEQCNAKQLKENCTKSYYTPRQKVGSSGRVSRTNSGRCRTKLDIMEKSLRSEGLYCLSTLPVGVCPVNCQATESAPVMTKFACVSTRSPTIQTLYQYHESNKHALPINYMKLLRIPYSLKTIGVEKAVTCQTRSTTF